MIIKLLIGISYCLFIFLILRSNIVVLFHITIHENVGEIYKNIERDYTYYKEYINKYRYITLVVEKKKYLPYPPHPQE